MKSCDMVIIVPVDGVTGEEAMRVQVWETVAELLRPELGKLYRQFNPSGSVWEHKYPRPFGVVLGRQEPEVFRELLKAGEEAQHEAAAYHLEAMIRKADLGSTQKIGNMQFYSTVVDGSDPELLAHGAWHSHERSRATLCDLEPGAAGRRDLPRYGIFGLSAAAAGLQPSRLG